MSSRSRGVVVAVLIWLTVVATTSTVAWVVIDRTGRGAYLTDVAGSGTPPAAPPRTTPVSGGMTPTTTREREPAPSTPPAATPSTGSTTPRRTPSSTSGPSKSLTTEPTAPARTTPVPAHAARVDDSVSVDGGVVGVSCQGGDLALRFVTPADGWAYTVVRSPNSIEVTFRRQTGEGESEVHAACSAGAPTFETDSHGEVREGPRE